MSAQVPVTTARPNIKQQTLREAYDPPANVLEVDVINPETHGLGKGRYTDYEVRLKVIAAQNFDVLSRWASINKAGWLLDQLARVQDYRFERETAIQRLWVVTKRAWARKQGNWSVFELDHLEFSVLTIVYPDRSSIVAKQSLEKTITVSKRRWDIRGRVHRRTTERPRSLHQQVCPFDADIFLQTKEILTILLLFQGCLSSASSKWKMFAHVFTRSNNRQELHTRKSPKHLDMKTKVSA